MEQHVDSEDFPDGQKPGSASQAQPSIANQAGRDSWYVLPKGGRKQGPYSIDELKEQLGSTTFAPGLRIRSADDSTWCAWENMADAYPELLEHGVAAEFKSPVEEAHAEEDEDDLFSSPFLEAAGKGWDSERTCDRCGQHSDCHGYPFRVAAKSVDFIDMIKNEEHARYTTVSEEVFWLCKPCRSKLFMTLCGGLFLLFLISLLLAVACFAVPQFWPERERLVILYIPGVLLGMVAFSGLIGALFQMSYYPFGDLFQALPPDIKRRCKKKAAKSKVSWECCHYFTARQWTSMLRNG